MFRILLVCVLAGITFSNPLRSENLCQKYNWCRNNGTCVKLPFGGFGCDCTGTGFGGPNCRIDMKACETAKSTCKNNGKCKTVNGKVTCDCKHTGYHGTFCQFLSHPCEKSDACPASTTCIPIPHKLGEYKCDCKKLNLTGRYCERRKIFPCKNGYHICSVNSTCVPGDGNNYYCECFAGNYGTYCDYTVDRTLCYPDTCANRGLCRAETLLGHKCFCEGTGHYGLKCETSENKFCAKSKPCKNGGKCSVIPYIGKPKLWYKGNYIPDYNCDCSGTGYAGKNCEYDELLY